MRVRTIGTNDEVARRWTLQRPAEGEVWRNRSYPNLYYAGSTIYSYGSHYPLGMIVEREGRQLALVNVGRTGYWTRSGRDSQITNRHRHAVRSAVKAAGLPIVEVDDVTAHGGKILRQLQTAIQRAWTGYRTRRSPQRKVWAANDLHDALTNYRTWCKFDGLECEFPEVPKFMVDYQATYDSPEYTAARVLDKLQPLTRNVFGRVRQVDRRVPWIIRQDGGSDGWEAWFLAKYTAEKVLARMGVTA